MFKKHITVLILLFSILINNFSQEIKNLQEINAVWEKFCQSFKTLDYELFASIHSEKLIRIPNGQRIVAYDDYIESYKERFEKDKKENSTSEINLRFFERTNNDSIASERGIYQVIRNKNKPNEKIFYGKFHALLIKENKEWKILMDYDNNEEGTISKEDFNNAYSMDDFDRFVKK